MSEPKVFEISAERRVYKFYYRTEEDLRRIKERLGIMQITKKEDKDYTPEEWDKFNTKMISGREKELRKAAKEKRVTFPHWDNINTPGYTSLGWFLRCRIKSSRALASFWVGSTLLNLERNQYLVDAIKKWNPSLRDLYFDITHDRLSFTEKNRLTISLKK